MKIHFLGIGGIGVSALAQYYLAKGHEVSGHDLSCSEITDYLQKIGIEIFIHKDMNTLDSRFCENDNNLPDLVIHTPAIKSDNLQLNFFKKNKIRCLTYPEALGELTKNYFTIAISGSHGKSTTTAMLSLVLIKAGLDPTVIVGTKLKEFGGTNFKMGNSNYLIIEACEYDSSFLNYNPQIIVVTNIDKEHLDYFKNYNNVIKAFKNFIVRLPENGILVLNKDDKGNPKLQITKNRQIQKLKIKIQNYSLRQKEVSKIKKILKIPGKHNISNALAVLEVARNLGVDDKITFLALSEFKGTWRRFETKDAIVENNKIIMISDYAHHPTEVQATLKSAREKYLNKKIYLIFQPHQYKRTFYLQKDFVKIFKSAKIDKIIITDIYDVAGREDNSIKNKISAEKLVNKINKKNISYISQQDCESYIKQNIKSGNILILMGAGDIYKTYDKF